MRERAGFVSVSGRLHRMFNGKVLGQDCGVEKTLFDSFLEVLVIFAGIPVTAPNKSMFNK